MLRLIILAAILSFSFAYDHTQERELYYYTTASYCRTSRIEQWTCGKSCEGVPRLQDVKIFYNSTGDNSGFGGYSPQRNAIYLVFRGTVPWLVKNWMQDISSSKISYPYCKNGCQVHQGFFGAFQNIKDQTMSHYWTLRGKYSSASLTVTGHSLGGAIATHVLVHLETNGQHVDHFSSQGSPRVGDVKFVDYVKSIHSEFKNRLVRSHDPVPHLPWMSQGFKHITTEVYYKDSSNYRICSDENEEDATCSNANWTDLNISDHQNYFGLNQAIEIPLCQ